ncbi:MAG TPA: GntR family transcriptional regulator [Lachnospiraceae bacterium]|nr:GntR family transcriptional regulator [Lachnospiraceae bacterium]
MGNDNDINEFMPLREVVFLTLRKSILKGELQPGERLMEIQLANKLGVSRTPIREAIRMLEHEGLVVMKPRRGAQVAKITVQELDDVLEVRKSLEMLAIHKACERMTEEDMQAMKDAALRFEKVVCQEKDDLTALAEADVAFHDTIYCGTRNRRLIQILGNLREQMYRFRIEYLKDEDIRKSLIDEHQEIMNAVERRDISAAVDLIAAHIDKQQKEIKASIESVEG